MSLSSRKDHLLESVMRGGLRSVSRKCRRGSYLRQAHGEEDFAQGTTMRSYLIAMLSRCWLLGLDSEVG